MIGIEDKQDMLYMNFERGKIFIPIEDPYKKQLEQHRDIINSLNPKFILRDYQLEAIGRFIYYMTDYKGRNPPIHLLFNMATGSGKTLIMAAAMLYLYKRGYRNFIFFTHLTNIIDKTRDNFLNPRSAKYLFAPEIGLGGGKLSVLETDNFNSCSERDINIMFTTISGLHNQWQNPKENALSPDDLAEKKIVLLGDEAHHFSAGTKKLGKEEQRDNSNWEHTILADLDDDMGNNKPGLLKVHSKKENILLEFTATIAWDDENILKKYEDKVLFHYDLTEFRRDKFSKNVSTLQFDAPLFDRVLAALVLSQYRLKVSQESKIAPDSIKPVVLLKANRVSAPKDRDRTRGDNPKDVVSNEFKEMFHQRLAALKGSDLAKIKQLAASNKVATEGSINISRAFEFFARLGINMDNLAAEIKQDFAPQYCLSVDTLDDTRNNQLLLNSLEDANNNIRAVFATEKLNEGWDVLNLFDIVRLYDTRDARAHKPGRTTVREAQLIGRGARYCPFTVGKHTDLYKRKFDDDLDNQLSVLERLHYHSTSNPKYIQELEWALVDEGILDEQRGTEDLFPKEDIPPLPAVKGKKATPWTKASIFLNERVPYEPGRVTYMLGETAAEYKRAEELIKLFDMGIKEEALLNASGEELGVSASSSNSTTKLRLSVADLGVHVVRTALGYYPDGNLDNLSKIVTELKSMNHFIKIIDDKLGANILVSGKHKTASELSQEEKLHIAKQFVAKFLELLSRKRTEYKGTKEFNPRLLGKLFDNKKKRLISGRQLRAKYDNNYVQNLAAKDWFAQATFPGATEQEIAFLDFIESRIDDIRARYNYFLVFRNDNHFSIYNFDDGAAINPDFLLIFQQKGSTRLLSHQIFVEPKGQQFMGTGQTFAGGNQGWKEDFLKRIEEEAIIEVADKKLEIIGLPFFHKNLDSRTTPGSLDAERIFVETFEDKLLPDDK